MIIGVPAKLADYLLVVWALVVAVHLNVLCHQLFLLRLPFLTRSDELNPFSRGSWPRSPSDKNPSGHTTTTTTNTTLFGQCKD
jgi:hypothetical protein